MLVCENHRTRAQLLQELPLLLLLLLLLLVWLELLRARLRLLRVVW